jgi:transcriptional regulator with XRE-family HTH domain
MTDGACSMTGMNFRQAIGEVIREQRQALGKSLREVSRDGFVSIGHLSDVERGCKEPSSDCLDAIANGLGINTYDLIIEAGYRMSEWQVPDTPEDLFSSQFANGQLRTQ